MVHKTEFERFKVMIKQKRATQNSKSASGQVPGSIRTYARLLDSQFRVGNFRFGIDPILGLIPGIGDFLGILFSGGLIAMAARQGASGQLMVLMSLNALLDATIGTIPILGDIFDFYYKANERNVRLLEKHFEKGKYQGSGKGLIVFILLTFLFLTILAIYIVWKLVVYLWEVLQGAG